MKKSNAVVVSHHYSGVRRFCLPAIILLLGLFWSLLGTMWAWPFAIGGVIGAVIKILTNKDSDVGTQKLLNGLSETFFGCALFLGIIGFVATHSQIWFS